MAPIPGLPCLTGLLHTVSAQSHPCYSIRINLLRYRELPKIVSHHLRLDLHLIELFARVDTNDTSNHLRDHNHVPEMGLDQVWLLVRLSLLLGFAQLFDKTHRLALEATVEPTPGTGVDEISEFFGCKVE